jgi:integrase
MVQEGQVFRRTEGKGKTKVKGNWFLRYWDNFFVDGKIVRKRKCVKLAEYSDRYRSESDLDDLVAEKLAGVRQAAKCPHSSDTFSHYVEEVYLPFVLRTMKPSTYRGYKTYWERYLKPRVEKYVLRDFTVAIVASLLKDIIAMHELNTDTISKVRSILSGIFTYAMSEGHFPARSKADNPASGARLPEAATQPKRTVAATREDVQSIIADLKGMPLERAAVAIIAFTGVRPGEARGLRWEEWDRAKQHIAIRRAVWHKVVGTPKTEQSERYVTVTDGLREILLDLWKAQGSPMGGYILAGRNGQPVILDNMAKRVIVPAVEKCSVCRKSKAEHGEDTGHDFNLDESLPRWNGWYSLRRFVGTEVRMQADSETSAKALGNSKAVADKHYIKPQTVLPDVRKAVNDAFSGLIQ